MMFGLYACAVIGLVSMPHDTAPLKTLFAKHVYGLVDFLWVSSCSYSVEKLLHNFGVGFLGGFLDWFGLCFPDLGGFLLSLVILSSSAVLCFMSHDVAIVARFL